jgi:hypothetical protein
MGKNQLTRRMSFVALCCLLVSVLAPVLPVAAVQSSVQFYLPWPAGERMEVSAGNCESTDPGAHCVSTITMRGILSILHLAANNSSPALLVLYVLSRPTFRMIGFLISPMEGIRSSLPMRIVRVSKIVRVSTRDIII